MFERPGRRCAVISILAALAVSQGGCTTRFVAKPANPLKPARTAGWDPGELSAGTEARLASLPMKLSWKDSPTRAIQGLEAVAAKDPVARRAIIEMSLYLGIRAHAKFLSNRGAAGYYLCASEHAFEARDQGDAAFQEFTRKASRYAVARLAGLRELALDNGVKVRTNIEGPTRMYRVKMRGDLPGTVWLDRFKMVVPTDHFRIANLDQPAFADGVGTPLVGKVRGVSRREMASRFDMADDHWMPLTATVQFGPPGPTRETNFAVYDRKNVESVQFGSRREPLAGDFSTAFAVRTYELSKENLITLGILGFLRGDRFFERTGLYPIELPRQDKIPVVFVHGLISDPSDWRFLHNALLSDPEIRQRYQFWAFYYPTSMPVQWSSTLFRRELTRVQKQMNPGRHNPQLNEMILMGHSMGGLLSRLQISTGGESIYRQYFTKPVEQLRLSDSERSMMKDMFYYGPNPDIDEVIFICVPHQGSELATNWIGRIGRALAKLPLTVLKTTANILTLNSDAIAADASVKPDTSIDSLSPGGKFTRTLQLMPMNPHVTKYSIIGNRGKAGPLEKSSDGVVPYWSSHLDGVPETVIASSHSGPEHPDCAAKVKELLSRRVGSTRH